MNWADLKAGRPPQLRAVPSGTLFVLSRSLEVKGMGAGLGIGDHRHQLPTIRVDLIPGAAIRQLPVVAVFQKTGA